MLPPLETGRFFFPPEWHPHIATILGFPSQAATCGELYLQNCREIVDLAAAIAEFEPVRLYARPEDVPGVQQRI